MATLVDAPVTVRIASVQVVCAVSWSVGAFIASIIVVIVVIVLLFVVYDAGNWTSIPTIPGSDFTM